MKVLIKEYKKNYKIIEKYYKFLSKYSMNNTSVGLVNEWILDNYYLLVKKERWAHETYENKKFNNIYTENKAIYELIMNTLINNNFKLNDSVLYKALNKYQEKKDIIFSYDELEFIPQLIYLSLIEKLNNISAQEYSNLKSIELASTFVNNMNNNFKMRKYFEKNKKILYDFKFIENVYNNLMELGNKYDSYLKEFTEILKENGFDLKKILEVSYSDTADNIVTISNVFSTILSLDEITTNEIQIAVNKTERLLLKDEYYKKSDLTSKMLYRGKIVQNSKKQKVSEYEFVSNFYNNNQEHIGFNLFKKNNYKKRSIIYLLFILISTITISLLLSQYLFKPQIVSFLFLLIPISEIVIQLTNKIVLKNTPRENVLKLDYKEGIPESDKTMVVIVTIVDKKDKVLQMFEKLEKYYILNKSDNLYFSLLGDAKSSDTPNIKNDDEIVETGAEEVKRLNKKYGKDIFGFIYRNRFYSEGEECYLGYERKRGALEQLNLLLLNKFTDKEKKKWFKCIKLGESIKNIKYVITLDVDTDLSIGNVSRLVGAMAHPLNKPVLNETCTKIVSGYSIIQPKVSVDIDASNKSIFTQIMAGLGGFDIYSTAVPELYQDVFDSASYCGKGIYNVEVFDKVLGGKLPENRILSHDLLESCFIRCGYASDIELIDDYPSSFIVDAKRRHRWARGDMQIFSYIFNKNISLICKWKIFDNIRRGLLDFSLLILLVIAYTVSIVNPLYWFLLIIGIILLPIIFYMNEKLKIQKTRSTRIKQYKNIIIGMKSLLVRTFLMFSAIPYNAKLYVDAFIRSIYRMLVSKKHLLAWVTAEDSISKTSNGLIDYFWNFKFNILFVTIFLLIANIYGKNNLIVVTIMSIIFTISPIMHYLVSKDIDKIDNSLSDTKNKEIKILAQQTWKYFEKYLTKENNYLIPDNYQETRDIKLDLRTSPTNIGMSILSIISAFELKFISKNEALDYIKKIIHTINKLEKFRGHLYNWYNIKTMNALHPTIISTVDSGNLVASLMVAKNFTLKYNDEKLSKEIDEIVEKTDFKFLYFEDKNSFSVGYDVTGAGLIKYKYNIFASEARITSYVSIAKGDIPYKNWFAFDKTLTKFNKYKGLISWNGTSFEYYMPLIFLKTYDNTLVDESYHFSYFCQKHYAKSISYNLPWGISESAYNELDDSRNYKYYAFGTPGLKLKESKDDRVVISPYASILVIEKYANEVYDNLVKYKNMNMYGKYGLYESYDYTDKTPVYSYFAHHQGMILSSITNYLTDGVIRDYLYDDVRIRAFDILNKEKTQIKPMIDNKLNNFTKIEYKKEEFKNSIRKYDKLSERPEISVLSNSKYSILINDRGNGFSRFNDIQLNRYRKISEQDYGTFLYIKDLSNNKIWSNTYSPINKTPDTYEVTYALDNIKYYRKDDDIITKTEIIVTSKHNAEIRKITFVNNSDIDKTLELTTYVEPIISNNSDDIGHRVFNNMFINSKFDKDSKSLIFERKKRGTNDKKYMLHRLITDNNSENYTYETLRGNFIDRNNDYSNPAGLYKNLTNTSGDVLDPIGCIRNSININANERKTVYIINGFGRSTDQIDDIINSYETKMQINDAFNRSTIMTNRNILKLMVEENDISNYNKALNYLYQTTKINVTENRMDLLKQNNLSQNNLWKFSVSGDLPIILVEIDDIKSMGLCKETLKMFEYYKSIGIYVELVFINSHNTASADIIKTELNSEIYKIYLTNDFNKTPGQIIIIDNIDIDEEEKNLFRSICRLWINAYTVSSLQDYIETLQNNKDEYSHIQYKKILSENIKSNANIKYENTFGGFVNDGKEYLIKTPNTPMPWINVLTNGVFGTIVSNNYNGFTFYKNSNEFKITSWGNETILDDKSEGITINNEEVCFNLTTYGFGYAKYEFKNDKYKVDMIVFVPKEDNVKVVILDVENLIDKNNLVDLSYWINPVLGNNEDKTARHIVSNFDKNKNTLFLENRYSMYFKNHTVYLSSSEKISNTINTVIKKVINMNVSINAKEKKKIVLMLGCDEEKNIINSTISKYQDVRNATKSYNDTVSFWEEKLNVINVNTPDDSFNYMINGWLSYQAIASRIYARAGFYQVSGAFGFRDQLQDACNMATIDEKLLQNQILLCASREFVEGDVLHWWHNENNFGLRSRYKDDYLWLIYATHKYIDITGDYSILDCEIPFVEGEKLKENEEEKGITFRYTDYKKTLYEHLRIIVNKAMNELAANGLPLMGGGDWNDGMNKVGIKGFGSSVWLGFFMYDVINKFININNHLNIKSTQEKLFVQNLKKSLKDYGYDKEYYLRAYFDDGTKLGSTKSIECKIDLISQAFAVITGIADKKEQELIDKNVDKYLVDKNNRMIKLLTPAFDKMEPNPGYIKSYPKGIRENGGQYTHACSWYVIALIKMGKVDKAYEYYQMLNPINHTLTKKDVLKYKVEPYVISADIYSNKDYLGQGGWTWYTGSAGWFYNVGVEAILGIKKHGNILDIKPNIPSTWQEYKIQYKYKNSTYNIKMIRKEGYSIYLDNQKVKEIILVDDSKNHDIVIEFGGKND